MHSDHLILIVIKALDYLIKVNAAFRSIWGAWGEDSRRGERADISQPVRPLQGTGGLCTQWPYKKIYGICLA